MFKTTVVIDPGHGGTDSGAIGNGLKEKDINLKVAQMVKSNLLKHKINPILTRDKDLFVSLTNRCIIANRNNARLFVSIHCNSYADAGANGIETLYYSQKGSELAKVINDKLVKATALRNRDIKQRTNLSVLKKTKMISCLTEIGFISNANDSKLLKSNEHLSRVAESITNGILLYLTEH
ncbi:N-acetylmuramoyl-L-alanine amidase family protein [Clostridium cylindrosporum]|uniref:N-acetylmuramoyl-L-alanine amidase n=1 Tax=Clostridium cylindrosporum DSM 605 TaxID=1121307 RepID=A0A0J8DDL3_CLOCY|nr:N-acetylmuramoyl-L-alanine amidase [Clostridium cylindrosporum]KMT22318.1 N-acetylmuramoyl-L-alanine amidase [Clostridium cylindrosporum DSM 605]